LNYEEEHLMIRRTTVARGITAVLVIANLCLLVIYLSGWTNPSGQNNKKTVVQPPSLVKEPLEITIEHRGQSIKSNEEFDGDADWLRNLKLKINNRSEKAITYVVLDLTFPETATAENGRVGLHQIRLGASPDLPLGGAQFYLAPGASKEISLDSEYPDMRKLIESRIPVDRITKIVIRLETALFDDGIKWFAGSLYRRNPNRNDPHKWIPLTANP